MSNSPKQAHPKSTPKKVTTSVKPFQPMTTTRVTPDAKTKPALYPSNGS